MEVVLEAFAHFLVEVRDFPQNLSILANLIDKLMHFCALLVLLLGMSFQQAQFLLFLLVAQLEVLELVFELGAFVNFLL